MSDQTANPLRDAIQEAIDENPVILFMKGSPEAPACGFSARTVAILQSRGARFAAVDILPAPRIRQELSALSNWPTIPQLFVEGELVGGCAIVSEMYQSGGLAPPPRLAGAGARGAGAGGARGPRGGWHGAGAPHHREPALGSGDGRSGRRAALRRGDAAGDR